MRLLGVLLATAMLAGVSGCSKGGGGSGGSGGCPSGQTLQGGQCVTAGGSGADGGVSAASACGAGGACDGGLVCVSGACQLADATCSYDPPKGAFTPRVAWNWKDTSNHPEYVDVLMTPIVVQLAPTPDATVAPAVVFNSIISGAGAGTDVPGIMRAVSGRDGTELWASDPAHPVNGLTGIAAGDLLGDGHTEFVTGKLPTRDAAGNLIDDGLIAFGNDGSFLWELQGMKLGGDRTRSVYWGAPSIANLRGGKEAQIVIGATVIDAHGQILCQGQFGQGDNWLGPISTVADVDLDGVPDIVTGNTIYDDQCQPKPGWPNGQGDGLVAVAKFTDDPHPNIVVVSDGAVRLQDWKGSVIWGPVGIPGITDGKGGGAPTVADFDGDGKLEIGVAGSSTYTVFKPFAANPVLWSKATQDQSRVTGSSVFDFTREGRAQVVYGDECYTRVYDGPSGNVLFEAPNPSCTVHENPVIADVDRDGRAEVVVATNSVCKISCPWGDHQPGDPTQRRHGITVFKDLRDHWVSTRSVWNEHAYHVTNVNEDGSIPQKEQPHWTATMFGESLNTFRMNPIGNGDFRAPDLAATGPDAAIDPGGCPGKLSLKVKVWNRGAVLVTAGVPVAFYQGGRGGKLLGVAKTAGAILPGLSETVSLDLTPPPAAPVDVTVALNDDGTGQGVVGECRTDNNVVTVPAVYCPVTSK